MESNEPTNKAEPTKTADSPQDLQACRQEIARLKDLVVRLSELVIKRVYHDKKK